MTGLQLADYVCIVGYLAFVIVLGSGFARQQKTTNDYFLAGKTMSWVPISISIYATIFSSISYVMAPAEAFRYDLQYLAALVLFPFVAVLPIILFIDVFVRLRVETVFQYLETRFNKAVSAIMMTNYIVFRCLYGGIVVYALSLVLHVVMGFPLKATIVGVGLGTVFYTSLGGLKGVIWTDVAQFFIMLGGISSSGMETVLCNLIEPGDRILIAVMGFFGERLAEVANRYGAQVDRLECAWGGIFDPGDIIAALQRGGYKLAALVHAETSTGALQPGIAAIAAAAHEHGALLVLDVVTSLAGLPVKDR